MEIYANKLIDKMIADKLTYSEIIAVVNAMQERLNRIRKVSKPKYKNEKTSNNNRH